MINKFINTLSTEDLINLQDIDIKSLMISELKRRGFTEDGVYHGLEKFDNGDIVMIISVDKNSINTVGKVGQIVKNDTKDKDYKVSFESGWIGYYNRIQLKKWKR
jgi:hypothetical protein